jgi:tetratricopeptide (TPR) repeat protein
MALAASARNEEAARWLHRYLSMPDEKSDQALLALGVVQLASGETLAAEDTLRRLVKDRRDSLHAGDGWYVLGIIEAEAGREKEAMTDFAEAVEVYADSRGGRLAAKRLADSLYEECVASKPKRSEWERIRDLYSTALRGMPGRDPDRQRLIARLNTLNDWIVFTPHSRPTPGYPSSITMHTVAPGEFLAAIASRYGVSIRHLKRLNDVPADSDVIRDGQELKMLRGRAELLVDTSRLTIAAWVNGRFLREYPVGLGRDGRTPLGAFTVKTREVDPVWWKDGEAIKPWDPRNILGTRWLGFGSAGAGRGIGIHGTVKDEDGNWSGVGSFQSNGCIRMRGADVEELFDFAVIGTEVTIAE